MNDAINAYLTASPEVNSPIYMVFAIIGVVSGILLFLTLVSPMLIDGLIPDNSKIFKRLDNIFDDIWENTLKICGFTTLICLICCCFFSFNSPKDKLEQQLVSAIENEYNIQVCSPNYKVAAIVNSEKYSQWNTKAEDDLITVASLNPNNSSNYQASIKQINNVWCLCKTNDDGDVIPLNPDHTIQDLKEN